MDYIITNIEESATDIYHHGILGMRWGIRRFQPYLHGKHGKEVGEAAKVKSRRKSVAAKWREKQKTKAKNIAAKEQVTKAKTKSNKAALEEYESKQAIKNAKQQSKISTALNKASLKKAKGIGKEKKERFRKPSKEDEYRNKLVEAINSGNAKKVAKYKAGMSDKEIRRAIDRISLENDLTSVTNQQRQLALDRLSRFSGYAKNISDMTSSAVNIYNNIAGASNALRGTEYRLIGRGNTSQHLSGILHNSGHSNNSSSSNSPNNSSHSGHSNNSSSSNSSNTSVPHPTNSSRHSSSNSGHTLLSDPHNEFSTHRDWSQSNSTAWNTIPQGYTAPRPSASNRGTSRSGDTIRDTASANRVNASNLWAQNAGRNVTASGNTSQTRYRTSQTRYRPTTSLNIPSGRGSYSGLNTTTRYNSRAISDLGSRMREYETNVTNVENAIARLDRITNDRREQILNTSTGRSKKRKR